MQCSQRKLFCDGRQPCTSCRSKRHPCEHMRVDDPTRGVDRISQDLIHRRCASPFLLCNGDAEIFSRFDFPRPVRSEEEGCSQAASSSAGFELAAYSNDLDDALGPMAPDFDLDILDGIFNTDQGMVDAMGWTASSSDLSIEQDTFGILCNEARLASLASDILSCSSNAGRSEADHLDDLTTLQHLLSPAQAHRALSRYFESWHRICRIVHRPTFTADTAPDVSLIAVLMLGAMYLPNKEDRKKTLSVIDLVEEYIFSQEALASDGLLQASTNVDDNAAFQFLQAAFLIVVTQYWTGSESSRRRVSTARFDRVIQVRYRSTAVLCNLALLMRTHRLLGN